MEKLNDLSFKGLYYKKVSSKDMGYIKDELSELKKLAKEHDIFLKSDKINLGLNGKNTYNVIQVTVTPIKESLNLFQRIFRPKATIPFYTDKSPYAEAEGEYLTDIVKKAISHI